MESIERNSSQAAGEAGSDSNSSRTGNGDKSSNDSRRHGKTHSIKRQLTLIYLSILCVIMLLMFLANTFLLEKFYERQLEDTLVSAFGAANEHIGTDGLDTEYFADSFQRMADNSNIMCVIQDEGYMTVYSAGGSPELVTLMNARLSAYLLGYDQKGREVRKGDNYAIQKYKDDHLKNAVYLELYGTYTPSGYHILLRVPVESIRASAKISNEFVFYMIIIAILLSIIAIDFMSRRITKPIVELTELSERMANLDFNAKYTSGGKNEIGRLGEHFNQMSSTLEKTISELKTANNELQANLDAKIKADDERREFLSNVSHELKTPLALIQGYAEGLEDCVNDDPESREYYASVIIDEAGKMNMLVRKLMALNQLESGYDKIEMVRFDLAELLRGKTASTGILADQKGASIELECPEKVHVWGDEFKVEEVLTNYLSNAINHVEGDLKIRVRVEEDRDRHKVRTSVFNTGKPIPEEDLDLVWDKFFKVDKARTRAYGGSGVGLAIVKAIMESFHQKYGVRNRDDGVEFWFELEAGDGELVDEEISDEQEFVKRQQATMPGRGTGEDRGWPQSGRADGSGDASGRVPVFSRTEGSKERDIEYQKKMQDRQKAQARKEAVRRAREEENRPVDASWVPVGKNSGKKDEQDGSGNI